MNMTTTPTDFWLQDDLFSFPPLSFDIPFEITMDEKQQKLQQEQLVRISEDQEKQDSLFHPQKSFNNFSDFEIVTENLPSETEEQAPSSSSQTFEKELDLNLLPESIESISNLLQEQEGLQEEIPEYFPDNNSTCSMSKLKKDQVVNRNLASADKKEKAHLTIKGLPNAKNIKLLIIYTGKFEIGETKYDYSNNPLELPENFLEPNTFTCDGKEQIYINKAKFLKEGNVGQLYNFMETKHNCRTPRLKDHPFKKNLGLRVQVFDEKDKIIKIWDFPSMFTLDGHRDKWKASKKSAAAPTTTTTTTRLQDSQSNHGTRIKSCLNESDFQKSKRALEQQQQQDVKRRKVPKLEQISSQ